MPSRLLARLRALPEAARGTSVIEFGLIAPVLAVSLMGVTDLSMGYSRKLAIEQAAYRSLEKIADGTVQTDYSALATEAAAAAGVPVAQVTINNWLECNRVAQASFTGTCPTGQMTSKYVQVVINATYRPIFFEGPLAAFRGADGNVALSASASVRVE